MRDASRSARPAARPRPRRGDGVAARRGASGSTGCSSRAAPRRSCRAPHGAAPEVVLINTSGGVTGGDRIDWRLEAGPGAALVATTPGGGAGLSLGRRRGADRDAAGARRRRARSTGCRRRRSSSTAAGSSGGWRWTWRRTPALTALETLVLGRGAMGETVDDRARCRTSGASAAAGGWSMPRRCGSTATSRARPRARRPCAAAGRSRRSCTRRAGRRDAARRGAARARRASDGVTGGGERQAGRADRALARAPRRGLARRRSSVF